MRWSCDRASYHSILLFRQGILFGAVALLFSLIWCNLLGYGVLSGFQLAVVLLLVGFGALLLAVENGVPKWAGTGAILFMAAAMQWVLRDNAMETSFLSLRVLLTVSLTLSCYTAIAWLLERLASISRSSSPPPSSADARLSISGASSIAATTSLALAFLLGTLNYLLPPMVLWQPEWFALWASLAAAVTIVLKIVDRKWLLVSSLSYLLLASVTLGLLPFVPTIDLWQRWWYLGLFVTAFAYLPPLLLASLAAWGNIRKSWRHQSASIQWLIAANDGLLVLLAIWSLIFSFASFADRFVPWSFLQACPIRATAPLCLYLLIPATAILLSRNPLRMLLKEENETSLQKNENVRITRKLVWCLLTLAVVESLWLFEPVFPFSADHLAWLLVGVVAIRLLGTTLVSYYHSDAPET
jgi:hypothetical protein